ncbi:MAG: 3-oxoacyl-[acyl-carrier-protein] reductase [Bryobacteraceae bacterium]|nr:3-oxoacyl-[acyl-carrier-protein] reductase [Bryobacteraceae bacterium]MCX7603743.1 3-oxoacyl-[acyl-carrier-protein] reductase [Bryobacteraceae bacterium]
MFHRVALVTGASRGIGREIALTLCRSNFDVVVASPEVEKNEEVAEAIRQCGGTTMTLDLDVSSRDSVKAGVETVLKQMGRIDVLVNNAGITRDALALRMKPEDWERVLQINLTGAFYMAQAVIPAMMKERWGRIINIASVVGEMGNAGQANYVSSKAGLIGLTKCLAQELASRNITVNAIAPGYIETDMTAVLPQEVKDRMLAMIPLRRFGQPKDIAYAVKFLASEEAGYITGAVLRVNGGMYM